MIEDLSESQVNDILSSKPFLEKYLSYEKEVNIDKLRNFFDDIETNKNYFRLNVKKSRKTIGMLKGWGPLGPPLIFLLPSSRSQRWGGGRWRQGVGTPGAPMGPHGNPIGPQWDPNGIPIGSQ